MEEDIIIRERIEKQTFLRKQIIEKGYNPASFQNYVESHKPEGLFLISLKTFLIFFKFKNRFKY